MIHAADVATKSTIAERGDIETARPGGKGTDDAQDGETVLTGLKGIPFICIVTCPGTTECS